MKIMKLLAACAMVGALATTTAMAAPVQKTFLGEYDATNNSIAINLANEEVAAYADTAAGDLTVLVTSVDVEGQITNSNIFQIDQGTLASLENDTDADTNVKLAVLKLSAAVKTDYDAVMDDDDTTVPVNSTYYVRLGGAEGSYIYDVFTFTAPEDEKPEVKPQVLIGNVDASTETTPVTLNDCTEICLYINGKTGAIRTDAETINDINFAAAAYCDGDDQITLNDCTEICLYINGKNPVYAGTTVDLGKYDTAK